MERAYPRLCAELRLARNHEECHRIMADLAQGLDLGKSWEKALETGPTLSFMLLGYLLQRVEGIRSYRAYLYSLLTKIETGALQWEKLLVSSNSTSRPV